MTAPAPCPDPTGPAGATQTDTSVEAVGDTGLPAGFLEPPARPGHLGRFKHYEVISLIGRGGLGVVFKAFDEALQRDVAIKVLAPQLATVPAARKRFEREARAGAALVHDNVVAIHAVEERAGLPYLVMQYVAGGSLQDRLDRDGPLPLADVLRIGAQTARALAAAHEQGLVHYGVKPGNIMLEKPGGRVKITDVGLARAAYDASITQSATLAGAPQYMAPEQARAEPVDARGDLFSLGSVLYAMCTGQAPFRGPTAMVVLKRVCEQKPPPVRDLSPGFPDWMADVIQKLHRKSPGQRFQSAAAVADLLEQFLDHLEHPERVPMPSRMKARVMPRFRAEWLILLGLVLLLPCLFLVGGYALTFLLHDENRMAMARVSAPPPPAAISGSSFRSSSTGVRAWAPEQATGPPDTWPRTGDIGTAWASTMPDGMDEWLVLEYDQAVTPTMVMVYETYNPGALTKVTAFKPDGTEVVVWQGQDPTLPGGAGGISHIDVQVDFEVRRVKLYLASTRVAGWNEIDAVGLVDENGTTHWAAKAWASSSYAGPVAPPPPP